MLKLIVTSNKSLMRINAYLDYKPEAFKDIYEINAWSQIEGWDVILV